MAISYQAKQIIFDGFSTVFWKTKLLMGTQINVFYIMLSKDP